MEYSRASARSVDCGVLKIKSVLVMLLTDYGTHYERDCLEGIGKG